MIILGMGTNLGDRMANLRHALQAINNLPEVIVQQVSPLYSSDALLPDNAPADWDKPYLNVALRCKTQLEPLTLLEKLKKIEMQIGRKSATRHWGPRIIDIDILAWGDRMLNHAVLTLPHPGLITRPFAFLPLAYVAPFFSFPLPGPHQGKIAAEIVEVFGSRFDGHAPLKTKQINQRIDMPSLIGIINMTPDSFSDGNQFLQPEKALTQAVDLITAGAEVLDIGAESTAPKATPVSPDQEWARLESLLTLLPSIQSRFIIKPKISIDTRHASVAEKALNYEIDWINDVTGLTDTAMQKIIAKSKVNCVIMHQQSIPADSLHRLPRNQDNVARIVSWADKQLTTLENRGIDRKRIIVDPGIGFGKAPEHSWAIIKHIPALKELGVPLLVGHSRKSFLSLLTPNPSADRDIETLTISLYLARQNVDYLRLHHIAINARGLKTMAMLEK